MRSTTRYEHLNPPHPARQDEFSKGNARLQRERENLGGRWEHVSQRSAGKPGTVPQARFLVAGKSEVRHPTLSSRKVSETDIQSSSRTELSALGPRLRASGV